MPTTAEGKQTSSQNALKHGLTATTLSPQRERVGPKGWGQGPTVTSRARRSHSKSACSSH